MVVGRARTSGSARSKAWSQAEADEPQDVELSMLFAELTMDSLSSETLILKNCN